MASTCELCGKDLSRAGGQSKLPGRKCCIPCASALFDFAAATKRAPVDRSDPLQALCADISFLAGKHGEEAGSRRDYERGKADAHNYDHCLVLCAIASKTGTGGPS